MVLKRNERGALIRSFCVDGELAIAAELSIPDASPGSDKAGEARQPLGAAHRSQVFIQNLIGSRPSHCGRNDVVILHRRRVVQIIESDRGYWDFATMMTRETSNALYSGEVGPVNGSYHLDHPAGRS